MKNTSAQSSSQSHWLERVWYQGSPVAILLRPLSGLYIAISSLRKLLYQLGILKRYRSPVPVIVVGNITAGGTGKTPLVIALVELLQQQGFSPGVISRGYGGKAPHYPFAVNTDNSPQHSGDEPLLIARRCSVPVVVSPQRQEAIEYLLSKNDCNVIISDDGLQHYALDRDTEIVVVDGNRGFGNGYRIPAGPLRESVKRLTSVDFILCNGRMSIPELSGHSVRTMALSASHIQPLFEDNREAISDWKRQHGKRVHAVAGIGNPQRFFNTLTSLGFEVIGHSFSDHHVFQTGEIVFDDALPVMMTEKDAVKISKLPVSDEQKQHYWVLPVSVKISDVESLTQQLVQTIKLRQDHHEL